MLMRRGIYNDGVHPLGDSKVEGFHKPPWRIRSLKGDMLIVAQLGEFLLAIAGSIFESSTSLGVDDGNLALRTNEAPGEQQRGKGFPGSALANERGCDRWRVVLRLCDCETHGLPMP